MGKNKVSVIQRVEEQGYPIDAEAISAPFNLLISPVSSAEVDATVMIDFSNEIRQLVRDLQFECELANIVIFTMVLSPEVPAAEDKMTWSKRSRSYKIRRKLDFVKWQEGSDEARRRLLIDSVIESINAIPEKNLKRDSKDKLLKIIQEATKS